MLKGGWWWKSCGRGLNGLYLNDPQDLTARQGMMTRLQNTINLLLTCSNSRYRMVQMERLGLHVEESHDDDTTQRSDTKHMIIM